MFSIMGTAVILILVGSYFSGKSAIELLENQINSGLKSDVQTFAKNSSSILSKYENMVELLSSLPITKTTLKNQTLNGFQNRKQDKNWQTLREQVMLPMLNLNKNSIRRLYIGSNFHGQNLLPNDSALTNYDSRQRLWYKLAENSESFAYTSYLTFELTNIDVTISKSVKENGNLLGVVGIDIFTDNIFKELQSEKDTNKVAVIIDQNGQIIYHSNKKYLLKNINADSTHVFNISFLGFAKEMVSGKTGNGSYTENDGNTFIFHYASVGNTGWRLGIGINQNVIDGNIRNLIFKTITADFLILIILLIFVFFLTRKMVQPIREVVEAMKNIAEGNLTGEKRILVKSDDEMGELANWFNKFSDSIDHIQRRSRDSGEKISELSSSLIESMSTLNSAAIQQSAAVAQTTSAMEEMFQTSLKIAENANKVAEIALDSQTTAKEGVDLINLFIRKMNEIENLNLKRSVEVTDLGNKVQKITEIIGLIKQINEQTKLIAFNAALEASGAGESGKRFAIVASEIRRLADTIQDSMDEIKIMISEIQTQTGLLQSGTKQSTQIVLEGVSSSKVLEDNLKNIYIGTKNTAENSQQITVATDQQKSASEQIVVTLHEISQAVDHVAAMSSDITTISEKLESMSVEFKNVTVSA